METRTYRTFRYALVVAFGLGMSVPLIYMVLGSLKSAKEMAAYPPKLLPEVPQWGNFADAWAYLTPQVMLNTFIFALGIVLLQMAISLPAGFALAKVPFRFAAPILALLVLPMLVPGNLTLIPLFLVTYKLGWLNTFLGLIVPMAAQCAFAILLFRQFFATLPAGLIEAARLDGAGWFRTFVSIGLPLARPAMATYFSVSFLTAWSMYIWPLVVAPSPELRVLNVALAPLAGGENSQISPAVGLAGAVIAMTPVLIVFIVFQKWYIKGIVGTGVE